MANNLSFGFISLGKLEYNGWKKEFEKRSDRITVCGGMTGESLVWLYQNAELLVPPSYSEGFGLTPLEAMSAGCPVVVSRAASLPEVCGDAVVYVDPFDVKSIAKGILLVWGNEALKTQLRNQGKSRAALLDWDTAAQKHREVIDKILESDKKSFCK